MKCFYCGHENPDENKFCSQCGLRLFGSENEESDEQPADRINDKRIEALLDKSELKICEGKPDDLADKNGVTLADDAGLLNDNFAKQYNSNKLKKIVIIVFALALFIIIPLVIVRCVINSDEQSYGDPKTYYFNRFYGGGEYLEFDGQGKCYSDGIVSDYYIQNGKYYVNGSKSSICLTIVKDGVIADMNGKEASSNFSKWNAPTEITFRMNNNYVLFLHSDGSFRIDQNDIPRVWGQYYLNQGVLTLISRQVMSDDYRITNSVAFSYYYINDDGKIFPAGVEDLEYYAKQH